MQVLAWLLLLAVAGVATSEADDPAPPHAAPLVEEGHLLPVEEDALDQDIAALGPTAGDGRVVASCIVLLPSLRSWLRVVLEFRLSVAFSSICSAVLSAEYVYVQRGTRSNWTRVIPVGLP